MKTDRILSIIIYLLNHDNVSASFLSTRFGVSVRTIQRDVESISEIGIPVYANAGKKGGYSILPNYKIGNMDIRREEQQLVVKALESLATSYTSSTLDSLIEKYNVIAGKEGAQKIFWDFGVTKENSAVQENNRILEDAIEKKLYVEFDYRNTSGKFSHPKLQPLAIYYKFYAWYLFTYSEEKEKYINYKVVRMDSLSVCSEHFESDHGDVGKLIEENQNSYYRESIDIVIEFDEEVQYLVKEYFPDFEIVSAGENICRCTIRMPAGERLWKALLLSFGGKVRIVSPESYREELAETARNFLERNR